MSLGNPEIPQIFKYLCITTEQNYYPSITVHPANLCTNMQKRMEKLRKNPTFGGGIE